MQLSIEFTIRPAGRYEENCFVITWTKDFGPQGTPVLRAIEAALENAYGVEQVFMRRYSAEVHTAEHILDYEDALRELQDALNDPDVIWYIHHCGSGDETIAVQVDPPLL